MATEDIANGIVNLAPKDLTELITALGSIGKWLQAIGIIVIIWLVLQVINWYSNSKKMKAIKAIQENLTRLERKVDKLAKKK